MKKSTGVVAMVLALAAVYTGASWYVGQRTQETYQSQIDKANSYLRAQVPPAGSAVFELTGYERSLFSSQARYSLILAAPDNGDEPLRLDFKDEISHGPLPFKALAAGVFKPAMAFIHTDLQSNQSVQKWFELAGNKPPLTADSVVALSGAVDSSIQLVPIKSATDNVNVDFSGGKVHLQLDQKEQKYQGNFQFARLFVDDIGDNPVKMTVDNLHGDFTHSGEIYVNDQQSGKVVLDKLDLLLEEGAFALNNFELSGQSKTQDAVANAQASYKVQSLTLGAQDLGSLEFGMQMNNLYMPAIMQMNDLMATYAGADEVAHLAPEDKQKLTGLIYQLLERKPDLHFSPLSWKNTKGTSDVGLLIKLQAPTTPNADFDEHVLAWLEALDLVKLDVNWSRPMMLELIDQWAKADPEFDAQDAKEQVNQLVDGLLETYEPMGLVKRTDEGVATTITYSHAEGEKLNFNGQAIPLGDLMLMAMGMM